MLFGSRPMVHLDRIYLPDLTKTELQWLDKMVRVGYSWEGLEGLMRVIRTEEVLLFRITSEQGAGLVGVQLEPQVLWIDFIVGKGLLKEPKMLYEKLALLGVGLGRTRMKFLNRRPGLERLYARLGFLVSATLQEKVI